MSEVAGDALRAAYRDQVVLVTGHTGFKGAWLGLLLAELGAEVHGYALAPVPGGIGDRLGADHLASSTVGDIRDGDRLGALVERIRPSIVLHLAAQALVPRSFREPVETFDVNVMGTARVLESSTTARGVEVVVVVTSDKVYENDGSGRAFVEHDRLGSADPYSASKAAAELVVASWRHSYDGPVLVSARAGNVIGGGDVSEGRVVPDTIRALTAGEPVRLRHPDGTRPWQHVLDPVAGYLRYGAVARARGAAGVPSSLNLGPAAASSIPVRSLVEGIIERWGAGSWETTDDRPGPEQAQLRLDASAAAAIGWHPLLELEEVLDWTVDWYRAAGDDRADIVDLSRAQIARFLAREAG